MAFTPKTIDKELNFANLANHNDNNAAIKTELDAHEARLSTMTDGAEPNQNAFASINDVVATSESDALEIVGSTGITVTTSPTNKRVTITATGTAAPGAHGSTHGEGGADPIPELVALQAEMLGVTTQLSQIPRIFQSVYSPTSADGINGDIWIKYIDATPIALDSVTVAGISTTGATIKAVKATVPTYWDPDDITATITFEVYIDSSVTPYGAFNWSQISAGITISGQSWAAGTTHTIKIRTKSVLGGKTDYSAPVVSGAFGTLAQPTGLVATPYSGQVLLTWNVVTGASSYTVKRATVNGGPYTTVGLGVMGASYSDTTAINGTAYYYVVSAVNIGFESVNSTQVNATPRIIQAQWLQFEFLDNFAGSGAYMDLWELEVNSPDILPTASSSWSASSVFGAGMEADKLADNLPDADHRWVSGSNQITNQFVKVNLGSLQNINKWRTYTSSNSATTPKTTRVYASTLASPSAKAVGVTNADWILISSVSIVPVTGGGWTPYVNV